MWLSRFLANNGKNAPIYSSLSHTCCSYEASAQDKADGTVKMHRKIVSGDVEDYATHIPGDVADLNKEEDMVYTKGVLMHANGISTVKMMPEV